MAPPPFKIDSGTTIGPYVVLRRLAQGERSVLFVAHDPGLEREVVLKIVPDDQASPAARAKLLREARALAAVDHPGVVHVYGTGEAPLDQASVPWIAMEYVRGTDLKRLLADRGPVPPQRALRWVALAAQALAAAHDAGVIHRDLKPSNVIVTHDDQIKIVDFGIAKRRTDSGLDGGRRDAAPTAYLAPEQVEHGIADERSDVWALGCILYELCVGVPPFGRASSPVTATAIVRDEPDIPVSLPTGVRSAIMACLRKSPFARVGSPRELASLLRDVMGGAADPSGVSSPTLTSERHSISERPPPVGSLAATVASNMPSADGLTLRTTRPPLEAPHRHEPHRQETPRPPRTQRDATPRMPSVLPHTSSAPPSESRSASGFPSHAARPTLHARGRIKGTAVRAGLAWFTHAYGEDAYGRVVERASPELRALLGGTSATHGVIASGWYDALLVGQLLDHMEAEAAPGDVDLYLQQLTTAVAKDNVGGVYRSLFKLVSTPELLIQNCQRIFSTYFDEGTLSALAPRRGELHFTLRGLSRHHPRVCRTIGTVIQNVLRAAGYTGMVLERTSCIADGAAHCTFEGLYAP